jgi:hypothetical protein
LCFFAAAILAGWNSRSSPTNHAWVGQEAAIRTGAPISRNNLTGYEHTLRELSFPPIRARLHTLGISEYGQVMCVGPFFDTAHRVIEAGRKRQATVHLFPDISPIWHL